MLKTSSSLRLGLRVLPSDEAQTWAVGYITPWLARNLRDLAGIDRGGTATRILTFLALFTVGKMAISARALPDLGNVKETMLQVGSAPRELLATALHYGVIASAKPLAPPKVVAW